MCIDAGREQIYHFASKFASVFMRPHAISGREEMAFLHELFYSGLLVNTQK
ncbi:MAG: hypothetical protein K6C31_01545 [Bacteroidales bacterium]|nr:hypothetical protein [Bacteroidales bacterium]